MNDSPSTRAPIPLKGGVSCEVSIVRENGRDIVVKQPLSKLKVVADWRSNPERFEVEVRALDALRELLGEQAAPKVLWVDAPQQRFAMELIEPRFRNWKLELLAGRVDMRTARSVGETLGRLHARSSTRSDIAAAFRSKIYFEELRIEPFFERVAKANPALGPDIDGAIAELRAPGSALVHGDFSPKNLLVDGTEVVILDLEIAHFGNPTFDVAFCLSHLILKSLRYSAGARECVEAARTFLGGYRSTGPVVADASLTRIVGCLLLARFDGASPVDYGDSVDEVKARSLAEKMIRHPSAIDTLIEQLRVP